MKSVAKKIKPLKTVSGTAPVVFVRTEFVRQTILGEAYGVRYALPNGRVLVLHEPTTDMMNTLDTFGFDFTVKSKAEQTALTERITTQLALFLSIILVWELDGEYVPCKKAEFEHLPVMLEAGLLQTAVNDFFSLSMRRTNGIAITGAGEARDRGGAPA